MNDSRNWDKILKQSKLTGSLSTNSKMSKKKKRKFSQNPTVETEKFALKTGIGVAKHLKAMDKENQSDDNEIVLSSQSTNESNLRKKINKTMLKQSKTPESTPVKSNKVKSPSVKVKKLSIGESTQEDFNEILNNIEDDETIEMKHDIEDSIFVDQPTDNTEYPKTGNSIQMDLLSEEEILEQEQNDDPLKIESESENSKTFIKSKRKQKVADNSSINKKVFITSKKEMADKKALKVIQQMEKIKERDTVSNHLLEKLKNLEINLQHEVPPQHHVETNAGTHSMNSKQIKEFEKYGRMKRGPFSKTEDKILKKNWNNFCVIHNWDKNIVQPFLCMRHNGKYYISSLYERRKFVQFLANGLPWRSLYSVYYRFKNLYTDTTNNGKFTSAENKIIMTHMSNALLSDIPNKCSLVAKLLNRKRHSIWQHYQKLKEKNNKKQELNNKMQLDELENVYRENKYKKLKWTYPVVKKIVDLLIEITSCKKLDELKNEIIEQSVWDEIEEETNINSLQLKNFWYLQLHMQLFCSQPIYLNDVKIKLIEYIYERREEHIENINWETVCIQFDGMTSLFLSTLFDKLCKYAKKKIGSCNIEDILEYLYNNHIDELKKKTKDAVLSILDYNLNCIYEPKEKKVPNMTVTDPFSDDIV